MNLVSESIIKILECLDHNERLFSFHVCYFHGSFRSERNIRTLRNSRTFRWNVHVSQFPIASKVLQTSKIFFFEFESIWLDIHITLYDITWKCKLYFMLQSMSHIIIASSNKILFNGFTNKSSLWRKPYSRSFLTLNNVMILKYSHLIFYSCFRIPFLSNFFLLIYTRLF